MMQLKNFPFIYFVTFLFTFSFLLGEEALHDKPTQVGGSSDRKKDQFQVSGLVDSYYAGNFNRPRVTERNYTTQAVRNNEFNINLAFLDATFENEKYRGRLAVQFGTSVNANYIGESTDQKYSNQLSHRNLQEAYAGIKLAKNTWLDAGIYFGHIGFESWISSYNWSYTRALALEYVPYYASGFRLTHSFSDRLTVQLHLMNGWSLMTDNNRDKSFGTQVVYQPTSKLQIIHNSYIGNDAAASKTVLPSGQVSLTSPGVPKEMRYFSNFIMKYDFTDKFSLAGSFDIGFQRNPTQLEYVPYLESAYRNSGSDYRTVNSDAYKRWYVGTIWAKYNFTPEFRLSGRLERYLDPENANIPIARVSDVYTKDPGRQRHGFQANGYTIGFDYIPNENALFRVEGKYYESPDPLFDYKNSGDLSRHEKMLIVGVTVKS
jgi:hypothetical protein